MDKAEIDKLIMNDPMDEKYTNAGIKPLFSMPTESRILIIGQAPGIKAQTKMRFWDDQSGDRLRAWLGVDRDFFYNSNMFAIIPMDFYYPGKGKSGDLPPRIEFAEKYHPLILKELKNIKLTILIGQYAQAFYLKDRRKRTVTETIKAYKEYLPDYLPLVHPSPRNGIWLSHNPWFKEEVIPYLQKRVKEIIN